MADEETGGGSAAEEAPTAAPEAFDAPGIVEDDGGSEFDPGGEATPTPREDEDAFAGGEEPPPAEEPPPGDPPPPPAEGETPPPAEGIEFNGKVYPDLKAVEAEHKSITGRLQATGEELREARLRANQWYQVANNGGGQPPSGPPQPGAEAPPEPEAPPAFADSLDWEFVQEVLEQKGPMGAMFYMADEMGKFVDKQLNDRIQTAVEPHQQLRERVENARAATALFQEAAATTVDESGAQMYPELSDPQASDAVLRIWQQASAGVPREVANTPVMVDYAVMKYRELVAANGNQSAPAPAGNSPGATAAQNLAKAAGASGGLEGNGAPPRPQTRSPEAEAARRVREAGNVDPTWGFAP